jgi:hypothetical protein
VATITRATRTGAGLLWAGCLGVALLLPAWFWDQGCFESEATLFVRQYTAPGPRPALLRIFDPHANDLGTYQGRELSYAIDLLDAHARPVLAARFGPAFAIPASALVASLVWVLAFACIARRWARDAHPILPPLLLLAVLTSFAFVSTMGLFYRSAKPMLAAVVVVWVASLLALSEANDRRRALAPMALLVMSAAVAGLLDRQGAFMVLAAALLLWVHARRTGRLRGAAWAMTAVAGGAQLYNFAVGPLVIWSLNGYWPDFSFQRIPAGELWRLPNHALRAVALLSQNILIVFGGRWEIAAAGVIGFAILASRRGWIDWRGPLRRLREYCRSGRHGRLVEIVLWALASQVAMFALMIARHGYVYRWIDHRYWYYPLPFLALAACGLLLLVNAWAQRASPRSQRVLALVLVGSVVGNLLTLGHRRDVMLTGEWFREVHQQCTLLKAALRDGSPRDGLTPGYAALYAHLAGAGGR